jgi:hypothetical protein
MNSTRRTSLKGTFLIIFLLIVVLTKLKTFLSLLICPEAIIQEAAILASDDDAEMVPPTHTNLLTL